MFPQGKIRDAVKWGKVVVIVAFLVLLIVFIWENWKDAEVDFIFFGPVPIPLSLLVLALFLVGVGIGFVMGMARGRRRE